MRYLAQFSEAPRTHVRSFWHDALSTEEWLAAEGKTVTERRVVLRARGLRALDPWLPYQSQPLTIDAWLDPMETAVTWQYLVEFLAEFGPERIWVPCGEDAWVGWTAQEISVRAARASWLWALVEDVWDPASWSPDAELEWWADGRLQHAVRVGPIISEQRSWMTGWDEWTLVSESRHALLPLWLKLVQRLGARPLRVQWRQELPVHGEHLLGIPARFVSCDLVVGHPRQGSWRQLLRVLPEPRHVRAHMSWVIPVWNQDWATVMTLRRVQRGSRLEATYTPRGALSVASWRVLQGDRRRIPILQIRPLVRPPAGPKRWAGLEKEAQSFHDRDDLLRCLVEAPWPVLQEPVPRRLRLRAGWTLWRWASQPGLWVVRWGESIEVHVEWPTHAHPGNIGIVVNGLAPIAMSDWVRVSRFERFTADWRYWAHWINAILLPLLERIARRET
ncbi:MAG: hypothetical protein OWU84_12965 [Firmicutes bacterium]|nr:hypothetical protein [Bacillota bacterium]